jgi:hypothetical protein
MTPMVLDPWMRKRLRLFFIWRVSGRRQKRS